MFNQAQLGYCLSGVTLHSTYHNSNYIPGHYHPPRPHLHLHPPHQTSAAEPPCDAPGPSGS